MKSIILSDTSAAQEIFVAVSELVSPLSISNGRMMLQENVLISIHPEDMTEDSVLLVNSDIPLESYPSFTQSHPVVTYGCNPKATVTASSLCEDKMVCCIQRMVEAKGFIILSPQEFSVPLGEASLSASLGAICILLLCFGESLFL